MFQLTVLAIAAALVSVDQLTKWLAVLSLKGADTAVVIPHVLGFTYVENRGAAFGILQGQRWLFLVFTGVVMAAMLALLLFGKFRKQHLFNISTNLIVAGGIGNFIDRLIHGYVVDFLEILLFEFPVFNVADCYVVVGSILLLVFFFFFYDDKQLAVADKMEEQHGDDTNHRTD